MSKNIYYDDVKIIKKPLKRKLKLISIILLIFLTGGVLIVSSFYISKSITVGNIGNLFVYGDTSFKIDSRSIFMVVLGIYDNKDEANKVSLGASIQGASGYVWEQDNRYLVVGSAYGNAMDAENVKKNLLESSNYSVTIEEIIFPKVELNFDEYENKDVSDIKNAIEFFNTIYTDIYDYSIKYDKGEMNNLAISSSISSMRGKLKAYLNKLTILQNTPNAKLSVIVESLLELDELLDTAIIRTIDNTGLNYYLKNTFISVARIEYECLNNLK